jgi:hypothetical protein
MKQGGDPSPSSRTRDQRIVLYEALAIMGKVPALWSGLDDRGKEAWAQVLFTKLVINHRGKVSIAF